MRNNRCYLDINFYYRDINESWRDGSDIKNACCFSRKHESYVSLTYIGVVITCASTAADPTPSYGLHGHSQTPGTHSQRHTYMHTNENKNRSDFFKYV